MVHATLYDIADDLTYNEKENYTLNHFRERINIYSEEDFDYEIHNVEIRTMQNIKVKIYKVLNNKW